MSYQLLVSTRKRKHLEEVRDNLIELENQPRIVIDNLTSFVRELLNELIEESDNPERTVLKTRQMRVYDGKEVPSFIDNVLPLANYKHFGIIDYLKEKCPELTGDELIICALTCLGFPANTSRYLMQMSHQASFYNTRSRIRKKLGDADKEATLDGQLKTIVLDLKKKFGE